MPRRRVGFARWTSELASGGNRYDDELVAALPEHGVDLREYPVPGPWPLPRPQDRAHLSGLLAAEEHWLVNNIVGSPAPQQIRDSVTAGRRVTLLLHYFPADDPALPPADRERLAGTEAQAVAAATAVLVTSRWAARQVLARYGRRDAVVAVPGTQPAGTADGSAGTGRPPMLLWLGRLTATKDPLTFVDALARVRDLDWSARLVGPDTLDPRLRREVLTRLDRAGLTGRVQVCGPRHGPALTALWQETDLLVHTSRYETWGMVVGEALARGIASVVASGTGAVEAQQAGGTFPPRDADALAGVLRAWLSDPRLRRRWREQAVARRTGLPTWDQTARMVAAALLG